jgi:hypothetical protein
MIYLVSVLLAALLILAGRCLYMEAVCNQLRTVNEGHRERMEWGVGQARRMEDDDHCCGSGI